MTAIDLETHADRLRAEDTARVRNLWTDYDYAVRAFDSNMATLAQSVGQALAERYAFEDACLVIGTASMFLTNVDELLQAHGDEMTADERAEWRRRFNDCNAGSARAEKAVRRFVKLTTLPPKGVW